MLKRPRMSPLVKEETARDMLDQASWLSSFLLRFSRNSNAKATNNSTRSVSLLPSSKSTLYSYTLQRSMALPGTGARGSPVSSCWWRTAMHARRRFWHCSFDRNHNTSGNCGTVGAIQHHKVKKEFEPEIFTF